MDVVTKKLKIGSGSSKKGSAAGSKKRSSAKQDTAQMVSKGDEEAGNTMTLVEQKKETFREQVEEKIKENENPGESFNDVLGYMPLREDFDVEYDNEAELFLAEMEFNGKSEEAKQTLNQMI